MNTPRSNTTRPNTASRRALIALAAGLCTLGFSVASSAQAYPSKPITLVLPLAPGGATDALARAVAQGVSAQLGQPVVIEHKPGAGGTLASATVARAPADGHTLLFANFATHATAPSLFKSLNYDSVKDFKAVSLIATSPHLLLVPATSPVTSVAQLIDAARAKGSKLNYASSGVGSPLHLAGEYFNAEAGTQIAHVPYKSSAPALTDLITGRVDVMFDNISSSLPFVQSGKLRAIGVTSPQRSALSPQTPTLQEQGLKNFSTYGWWGVLAPRGVPDSVVAQWNSAIRKTLASPELQATLTAQGFELVGSTPEAFDAHIAREIAKWGAVIRSANVGVE